MQRVPSFQKNMSEPIKAIAMVSSGLDSMLAARIMRDQGIEVLGLHCLFRLDPTQPEDIAARVRSRLETTGAPVRVDDITEPFFRMLLDPPHGYGKGVNPCIDCKIFMFRHAKKLMEQTGARFLITGEVVGQRPMSQHKPTLFHIEKESGLQQRIVRPLSARILPQTLPEEKGWIRRDRLYGISGRNRKEQMALAESFGIHTYPQPAGGCILTDPAYAKRAEALMQRRGKSRLTPQDFNLLRLGRHFWTDSGMHVIAGRHEADNAFLESFRGGRWTFEPSDVTGPLVLAEDVRTEEDIHLAAAIAARYCSKRKGRRFRIQYRNRDRSGVFETEPAADDDIRRWRV